MTDADIIKAFECCKSSESLTACWKCPAVQFDICCNGTTKVSNGIINKITDLIDRQQAEIEALINGQETLQKYIPVARAEAIKEFADRLKREIAPFVANAPDVCEVICNTAKEMVGGFDA